MSQPTVTVRAENVQAGDNIVLTMLGQEIGLEAAAVRVRARAVVIEDAFGKELTYHRADAVQIRPRASA